MYYTNDKVTIRFEHGMEVSRPWLAEDRDRAQRILAKHKNEKAMCLCTPAGVLLHVVNRLGAYHLATMPGRGHHHALSCVSYLPDEETSGLRHYGRDALCFASGIHRLSIQPTPPVSAPFTHFSPSAALQYLWNFAGLNVCTPKTVQARKYVAVARSLEESCSLVHFNGRAGRPYIPIAVQEPGRCQHVIGQIRRINHAKYDNGISLSADRVNTFWVDRNQWDGSVLSEVFGNFEEPRKVRNVWLFANLWHSPKGNLKLFDVGLLPVTNHFLPAISGTKDLISSLIHDQRRFYVCLPYDAGDDDTVPAAVLIDTESPKNLYLPSRLVHSHKSITASVDSTKQVRV